MIVPFSLFFYVVADGFHLDYSKHLEIKVIVGGFSLSTQLVCSVGEEIQTYELDKRRRTFQVAKFVSLKKVLNGVVVGSQGWFLKTTLKVKNRYLTNTATPFDTFPLFVFRLQFLNMSVFIVKRHAKPNSRCSFVSL